MGIGAHQFWWIVFGLIGLSLAFVLVARWLRRGRPVPSSFTELEVREVEIDGWTIRYHRSGKGPDLVLVHGLGANLYCWRWMIPLLNPWANVLALDLPGFGGSSKRLDVGYGLDEQAERLARILDHFGIRRAHLVGSSMGGNVCLGLALKFPDRVEDLSVIAPATSPKLVPWDIKPWLWMSLPMGMAVNRMVLRQMHARTIVRHHRLNDGRIEESIKTYGRNSAAVRTLLMSSDAIRDQRLPSILKDVKQKVQILWGSQDKLVNRKVIDALEAVLPAAESHIHIGGGHHLQEDEPEWCADKILAFFPLRPDDRRPT
jgi:abhydrolase domain-containing protein 6